MSCDSKWIDNACFFTDNYAVDSWIITSSTAAVGYSGDRIKETNRKLTWRSTTNAASWVEGNYNAISNDLRNIDSIVIVNHNCPVTSHSWTLQMWDEFGGSLKTIIFDPNSHRGTRDEELIEKIRPYRNYVLYFDQIVNNVARWRLTTDITTEAYQEIGRIILGTVFRPVDNIYNGQSPLSANDETKVDKTYGIDYTSDNRPKSRMIGMTPPNKITISDVAKWLNLVHVVGKRSPIFVDPYPREIGLTAPWQFVDSDDAVLNMSWQMYGYCNNNVSLARHDRNNMISSGNMRIEEQA